MSDQHITNQSDIRGAQGQFHGPVTFNQFGQPTPALLDHLADALRAAHQRLRDRYANQRAPTVNHPYKFLDFFELEDAHVFYGRDAEIEQVFQLQQHSRLAVLHAPSGAGKIRATRCSQSVARTKVIFYWYKNDSRRYV
jgi:hypothetical protein